MRRPPSETRIDLGNERGAGKACLRRHRRAGARPSEACASKRARAIGDHWARASEAASGWSSTSRREPRRWGSAVLDHRERARACGSGAESAPKAHAESRARWRWITCARTRRAVLVVVVRQTATARWPHVAWRPEIRRSSRPGSRRPGSCPPRPRGRRPPRAPRPYSGRPRRPGRSCGAGAPPPARSPR